MRGQWTVPQGWPLWAGLPRVQQTIILAGDRRWDCLVLLNIITAFNKTRRNRDQQWLLFLVGGCACSEASLADHRVPQTPVSALCVPVGLLLPSESLSTPGLWLQAGTRGLLGISVLPRDPCFLCDLWLTGLCHLLSPDFYPMGEYVMSTALGKGVPPLVCPCDNDHDRMALATAGDPPCLYMS